MIEISDSTTNRHRVCHENEELEKQWRDIRNRPIGVEVSGRRDQEPLQEPTKLQDR